MTEFKRPNIYPPYCKKCQEASNYILEETTHVRNQIQGAEILLIKVRCDETGFIRRSRIKMQMSSITLAHPSGNVGGVKTFEGDPKEVVCLYLKKARGIL